VEQKQASKAFTALVCPAYYARAVPAFANKFDKVITYEDAALFLATRAKTERGELARRLAYRRELLAQAIDKSRRGYEAVPLAVIEQFNAKYVQLVREKFPSLDPGPSMLKEGRPGESKTMIFGPATLPSWPFLPQTRIVHQLREGNANVCFYGWGDHFTKLAGAVAQCLSGTNYKVVPTINKRAGGRAGLMIVAETPVVDNIKGFDAQRAAILSGMERTDALRRWMLANRSEIEAWSRLVK
jgi:hypothetical protein